MSDLPPHIKAYVEEWLSASFDEETMQEVQRLILEQPESLEDLFGTMISFGTGGMRGIVGVGRSRLNKYTIRIASQGLANYILKTKEKGSLFISYDPRHHSRLFAEETARVMAGNGIKAYITRELRPTPFVSFGCRHHKCTAAVMITASHNPPEYNGYKVYWSDGAQVVSPHDQGIMDEVAKVESQADIKLAEFNDSLICEVGADEDEAYYEAIAPLQNYPKDNASLGHALSIVYSPLHGAGVTLLPEALKRWGFTSLSLVEEQKEPHGSFPSVKGPNPEEASALALGIESLEESGSDLFIATDPDADRISVVAMHQGYPVVLNGNQIAALCVYYLCQTLKTLGKMPTNGAIVTTIVTTELLSDIATVFNIDCYAVLTGFKYIGEKIHEWELNADGHTFIFGAEESLGYLYGTHSRDKDGIITACLIAEMTLQLKKQEKTLIDLLQTIYHKFGIYKEKQLPIAFASGQEGLDQMQTLMETLRKEPLNEINGSKVTEICDYQLGIKTDSSGNTSPLDLPKSNVLLYRLSDGSRYVIRPSGTEPKMKIYGMVKQKEFTSIEEGLETCDRKLDKTLHSLKQKMVAK